MALPGAALFASAGRWDLPWFWAYLGVFGASAVIGLLLVDPSLVRERLRPGPGGEDHAAALIVVPVWVAQHVVAGLDVGRHHWTDTVPPMLQAIALAGIAVAMAVTIWAMAVNRFFSSVIRIQTDRGHHLVTSGPYAYVRHRPMPSRRSSSWAAAWRSARGWRRRWDCSWCCPSSDAPRGRTASCASAWKATPHTPLGSDTGSSPVCGDGLAPR